MKIRQHTFRQNLNLVVAIKFFLNNSHKEIFYKMNF